MTPLKTLGKGLLHQTNHIVPRRVELFPARTSIQAVRVKPQVRGLGPKGKVTTGGLEKGGCYGRDEEEGEEVLCSAKNHKQTNGGRVRRNRGHFMRKPWPAPTTFLTLIPHQNRKVVLALGSESELTALADP